MDIKTFDNEVVIDTDSRDYLRFVTVNSTIKQRRKFDIGDIFINAAICLKCHKYIRSINRLDFKSCNCGAVKVDGGSQYAKRIGRPEDYVNIIENFLIIDENE